MTFRFGKIGGFGLSGFGYSGFQQIFDGAYATKIVQAEQKVCENIKSDKVVKSAANACKQKISTLKNDVFTKESKISK